MSEIFLFTVEYAFQISGRPGPVLVPGIPGTSDLPSIGIGSPLLILTPSGERISTQLACVEMVNYGRRPLPDTPSVPIGLPSSLSKDQVPAGSKVYLAGVADDGLGPNNSFKPKPLRDSA